MKKYRVVSLPDTSKFWHTIRQKSALVQVRSY